MGPLLTTLGGDQWGKEERKGESMYYDEYSKAGRGGGKEGIWPGQVPTHVDKPAEATTPVHR